MPSGFGDNFILGPLASDMSFTIEQIDEAYADDFGPAGACVESYALFGCAIGLGTMLGPLIGGLLYHNTTWAITGMVLATFSLCGSVPVVLHSHRRLLSHDADTL